MAAKIDLGKLSLEDLKALKKSVEKEIKGFRNRQKAEALKEIQAVAKKHGLSIDEVVGGKKKTRGPKAPAKYRNPANADETWSGRGRQPAWYKAAIGKGKSPKSLEI